MELNETHDVCWARRRALIRWVLHGAAHRVTTSVKSAVRSLDWLNLTIALSTCDLHTTTLVASVGFADILSVLYFVSFPLDCQYTQILYIDIWIKIVYKESTRTFTDRLPCTSLHTKSFNTFHIVLYSLKLADLTITLDICLK